MRATGAPSENGDIVFQLRTTFRRCAIFLDFGFDVSLRLRIQVYCRSIWAVREDRAFFPYTALAPSTLGVASQPPTLRRNVTL
jgi:hypothetical protein